MRKRGGQAFEKPSTTTSSAEEAFGRSENPEAATRVVHRLDHFQRQSSPSPPPQAPLITQHQHEEQRQRKPRSASDRVVPSCSHLEEEEEEDDDGSGTMSFASMTIKDRTKEFTAAAERAAKTLAAASGGSGESPSASLIPRDPVNPPSSTGSQSEFAKMSSRIGHGIHGTSLKLERLAQLAKRSGMFDDPAQEIAELSAVIKQDITALNTAIAELQNHAARNASNKQGSDHSVTVVDTLKSRLMGATKSFKEVLTLRQENVKNQNNRRQMFSNSAAAAARPNPFARGDGNFPRLAAPGMGAGGFGGAAGGNLQMSAKGGLPTHSTLGGGGGATQQQQGQLLMANQDQYLSARAEALQNVERTITELGGIFQQLATMVAEQGELAVRIDENVDDAVANVDNAQTHLLKYLNRISSNRWLIMKIFGILISFLVFFVVFIA